VNYQYGSGPADVDEFFREKKSWSKVKDKIVGDYINCYLKTVPKLGRPILIVDAFAGPGRFGDGTDGSPLIICKAMRHAANRSSCLFADVSAGHRAALEENLSEYIEAGVCDHPYEDCERALTRAIEMGSGSTIFFYLDPYGIRDLEFDIVKQIYEREIKRSTEVLINFNFRTFMRMSGNWGFGDSASEVARKVKKSKIETVNSVMGGDYWQRIVCDPQLGKIEREDAVVNAYLERVREYFKYGYAIPVKERQEDEVGIPVDELAHYHLIFGTRSSRAVMYMNDVALNALDPYLRQFKDGLLFDFTPQRHLPVRRDVAKNAIVESVSERPLKRPEIYEAVIPRFFMHHKKKDYRAMVDELTFSENRLFADERAIKRRGQLNDEVRLSAKPWRV
jgi:three-Cys-motif partner protein